MNPQYILDPQYTVILIKECLLMAESAFCVILRPIKIDYRWEEGGLCDLVLPIVASMCELLTRKMSIKWLHTGGANISRKMKDVHIGL